MIEYSQITHKADKKTMGVVNGVSQFELDFSCLPTSSKFKEYFIETDASKFLSLDKSLLNRDITKGLKARRLKGANITDFIVFSPYLFGIKYIISSKFVGCLEDLEVSKSEYLLLPIELEGIIEEYKLLFIPWISDDKIDFENSLIYPQFEQLNKNRNYIKVSNYEEYVTLKSENPFINFEKIVLKENLMLNRDLFHLQASPNTFFSKRLLNEIRKRNLTNITEAKLQIHINFEVS